MRVEPLRTLLCLLLLWGCAEVEPRDNPPRQLEEAATVPSRFTDTTLVENIDSVTTMALAPDGRIFVCEQAGKLRIIENGKLLPEPFLSVETNADGERGLLGVAFDPDFPRQPYVYVYYTATSPSPHNRVSRFTASGNRAVAGSERILLDLEQAGGHQPQRRRPPLRGRRQAVRGRGGQLEIGERAEARHADGQAAAAGEGRHHPLGQPVLHAHHGRLPRHLGARPAQPLQLRRAAGHRPPLHQRRGGEQVGGDQRGRRRSQLRLAGHRGPHERLALPRAAVLLLAWLGQQPWLRHHRGHLLQPAPRPVPLGVRGALLLLRLLQRVDPHVQPEGWHRQRVRHGPRCAGGPRRGTGRQPLLPGPRGRLGAPHPLRGDERGARARAPAREPDGETRPVGHLHGGRHRDADPALPVAAGWQGPGGADVREPHVDGGGTDGLGGALPGPGVQRLRLGGEQRGRPHRAERHRPRRHHHLASGGDALQRRRASSPSREQARTRRTARCRRAPSPGAWTSTMATTCTPSCRPRAGRRAGSSSCRTGARRPPTCGTASTCR